MPEDSIVRSCESLGKAEEGVNRGKGRFLCFLMLVPCLIYPQPGRRVPRGCKIGPMPQIHREQFGVFHVTTNTANSVAWCTWNGIPECLIDHLCKARDLYKAELYAFCILPNHLHIIVAPSSKGISKFMQAFKTNSAKYLKKHYPLKAKQIGWQENFYDERIRDGAQRSTALAYVQGNGMKHGLVQNILDWPWTSLHFPSVLDPMDIW